MAKCAMAARERSDWQINGAVNHLVAPFVLLNAQDEHGGCGPSSVTRRL
jgi:hypothetical protein